MIPHLSNKANDEKYFKSIRYFSHLLKGEKRTDFISELSNYNIYLAAQCLMSAEKEVVLEKQLKIKSESFARDFKNTTKSANGFLALAEFECYEVISSLLIDVKKPSNVHLQVFIKILAENNLEVFVSFIKILLEVNNILFIQFIIRAYNGQVLINHENKKVFGNLFDFLLNNRYYGLMRVILDKYNLFEDILIILKLEPTQLINKIIFDGKKKLTTTKLAYEISKRLNLFNDFPPSKFISLALAKASNSGTLLALGLAVEHKEFNNSELDERIVNLLTTNYKKNKYRISQFMKKGLSFYVDNNHYLKNMLDLYQQGLISAPIISIEQSKNKNATPKKFPELTLSKKNENIDEAILAVFGNMPNKDFNLNLFWSSYFQYSNTKSNPPLIQTFFKYCIENIESDLRKVCSYIKVFFHQGLVKWNSDYGCYISPLNFKSQSLMFLHPNQIKFNESQLNFEEEIKFRIIGYNKSTERVNITMLTDDEIEKQIQKTQQKNDS